MDEPIAQRHERINTTSVLSGQQNNTGLVLDVDNSPLYHFGMGLLSTLRARAGLSQSALAKLAKTSQPQIFRLENDERELTRDWAIRLAPHLDILPEELVFGGRTVPLKGYVGAGAEAHYYDISGGYTGQAAFPRGGTERTVAVEIRGESLGPVFEGWIVYYDESRAPPTSDLLGRLCVIGLHSGQILVRTLLRGRKPQHFDLLANGGGLLTDQTVLWAAPVTGLMPPSAKLVFETENQGAPPRIKPKRKRPRHR